MKYQEIISRFTFPMVKFEAKALPGIGWARRNFIVPSENIFRNERASVNGFETDVTKKFPRGAKQGEENKAIRSTTAILSDESRQLLDAILTQFHFLEAVDISSEVGQVLTFQNEHVTTSSVDKYSNEIKVFLLLHDFVFIHSSGVIVNSNGMRLSSLGCLSAYEKWVKDEEERLMQSIGKNLNYPGKRMSDSAVSRPVSEVYDYTNKVSFIFRLKQVLNQLKEKSDVFFRKVLDWSLA